MATEPFTDHQLTALLNEKHLSWMFATLGKRVISADLDPQANLTAAFLDEDRIETLWYGQEPGATIFQCVKPLTAKPYLMNPHSSVLAQRKKRFQAACDKNCGPSGDEFLTRGNRTGEVPIDKIISDGKHWAVSDTFKSCQLQLSLLISVQSRWLGHAGHPPGTA